MKRITKSILSFVLASALISSGCSGPAVKTEVKEPVNAVEQAGDLIEPETVMKRYYESETKKAAAKDTEPEPEYEEDESEEHYVLNKNSKKFHYAWCDSVSQMKEKNKKDFYGDREEVIDMGYIPCKNCKP